MANESSISVPGSGTRAVRTNTVTESIAGVATAVDQQVIAISDPLGNIVDLATSQRIIAELLRLLLIEAKITNALLVEGLNVETDIDALRADPAFSNADIS